MRLLDCAKDQSLFRSPRGPGGARQHRSPYESPADVQVLEILCMPSITHWLFFLGTPAPGSQNSTAALIRRKGTWAVSLTRRTAATSSASNKQMQRSSSGMYVQRT